MMLPQPALVSSVGRHSSAHLSRLREPIAELLDAGTIQVGAPLSAPSANDLLAVIPRRNAVR
jgi:hypothetical protein